MENSPASQSFGFTGGVMVSLVTAALGCVLMALSLFGWCFRDLSRLERAILLPCAVLLMLNEPFVLNVAGLAVALVVLANSITLTPGTITVELEGRELAVHCLDRSFSKGMAGGDFVKLLHRIEEVAL